ncbi:hypothetical protein DYB38_012283, partial [Aphanomyces astaci]
MNPGMSHHPGMSGMMSNQPGMPQHQQHGMSGMNPNAMMGMGMGMPQGNNQPGGNMGGGGGMGGHNPMQHMSHQQQHHSGGGGQHHMMNSMNSMQHGGSMNHPMNSMGNMNNGGMLGNMHPSSSNAATMGYTNTNLSYGNNQPITSTLPGQSIAHIEWRAQFNRDQRASLIAKVYHEMVRVSTEPPGIALWINVAWFELTLFKECQTREDYINQIIKRLQHLKTQGGDIPPGPGGRHPGSGMPSHPQQPPHNPSAAAPYSMNYNPNNSLAINTGMLAPSSGHLNGGGGGFPPQSSSSNVTPKQAKGNKPPPSNGPPPKNLSRTQSATAM